MTTRELERLIGERIPSKRVLQLAATGRLFHREDGDRWREYSPYPAPAAEGRANVAEVVR